MSVRRRTYRDPDTGVAANRWMVDIDYQHPDGRRVRIRKMSPVQSLRGAEKYERELRVALLNGSYERKEAANFKEFVIERWLPTYPKSVGNRPSSIREKDIHCRVHLVPFFGKHRLDQITGELAARFFAGLRSETEERDPLSEKSIKNIRATLRRILASAKEWGEIQMIPDLPKVKVPDADWDFYQKDETDRLIEACRNEEERALLLFAVRTGARAGEQLALEWGSIDWHNHLVVFRRSETRGELGPTKSRKDRKVPMTPALERALKQMKHLRGERVFCNMDGTPLTLDQLHEHLWMVQRRAGLRRLRWHDLRHTFASQAAIAGVPLPQIQQWLGHSTIAMTMRYAHLAPGGGAEWIKVLEGSGAVNGNGTLTAREPTASQ